ncbi:ABC transporter ATP-binding protein [Streptomyces tsukubensis]|uniref:ABC-type xenobiotic transporter n=1 Tax=Streptomyces tsukubensis TaxID=83656 RepID=A0A1V4A2C9_9ACTN|nr:ATP-binding cassette domain-containing protein [Streptomyces tsukubensis]OON72761.1 ABC transporter [Streptomyces tsukubensis]QFR96860.1 ATP-binding cassette domain-containing protein [Streptomyces tsukubensis]
MTDHSKAAITASGLRKAFGDHVVLDGIDVTVEEGTVYAMLGPNGAGKTTTVNILTTLLTADAGSVVIAGHDVASAGDAARAAIGVTGQFSAVDNLLTGRENLQLIADFRHLGKKEGRERGQRLLDQFDLVDSATKPVSTYSQGMRRRLDLAMTLVGNPRVIFLDEPTTGLDPRSRHSMWQLIRELTASGVTIFLTTQYLDEADELADRVAVLDGGRIVAEGTPDALKQRVPGGHVQLQFADAAALARAAACFDGVTSDEEALTLSVPSDGSPGELRTVLDRLGRDGIEPSGLSMHSPDLDDVFFALTGNGEAASPTTDSPEGAVR